MPFQVLHVSVCEDDHRMSHGRPEFTEVSPQITGLKWSDDGYWLYVATTFRTVVYRWRQVKSLRERCLETLHCERNKSEASFKRIYSDTDISFINQRIKDWASGTTWEPHWWDN